jgi:hypothetical protein
MSPGDRIGGLVIMVVHGQYAELICDCGQVVKRKVSALRTARSHGSHSTCKGCRVDAARAKGWGERRRQRSYEGPGK